MNHLVDTDYRELLRQYYVKQKERIPSYSYRKMGRQINIDPSQLFKIMRREQHLPSRCVHSAKELLIQSGISGAYFEILVATSKTYSPEQRQEFSHKSDEKGEVECIHLDVHENRFLSHWWIPAVLSYLEISEGMAIPEVIASRVQPPITKDQATEALNILKTLHLVKRLPSGRLGCSHAHISVSGTDNTVAVQAYQKQSLSLGSDAIDAFPAEERDISTLTLAVDGECFRDLVDLAKEFRRQVTNRVNKTAHPDRVLQWSMALHPIVPKKES